MRNRCVIVFVAVTLIAAGHVAQAQDTRGPMVVAEGGAHSDPQAAPTKAPADDAEENLSPEEKMRRRFPQPVRVGDLIGARHSRDEPVACDELQDPPVESGVGECGRASCRERVS